MRLLSVAFVLLTTIGCVRAGEVCAEGTFQCRFNNVEECIDVRTRRMILDTRQD